MRRKRISYRTAKTSENLVEYFHSRRKIKTLAKAAKPTVEIWVAFLSKETPKAFYTYVNSWKRISKDIDGSMTFSMKEMQFC